MALKYEHRSSSDRAIFPRDEGTFDHIVENVEAMVEALCWVAIEAPSKSLCGMAG